MATPAYGQLQIEEFRPNNETFAAYLERVELYFIACGTPDEKKVATFLTVVGRKTYSVLRSLVAPALPQDKTFADLVSVLKKHYDPKPIIIAERFHFHKRAQAVGESIAEYMAELRSLATHCQFGDHLNDALRDRLVCGLRDVETQTKLLAVADLTLTKTLEIAQGSEAARKNSKALHSGESHVNVTRKACYRCGRSGHAPKDCRFREAACLKCGKKGHLANVCKTRQPKRNPQQADSKRGSQQGGKGGAQGTKYVNADPETSGQQSTSSGEDDLPTHHVGGESNPPIQVSMVLNGKPHLFELDTGAAVTIMSQKVYKSLLPGVVVKKSSLLLKSYSGERIPVIGEADVEVHYQKQKYNLSLTVVAGNGPSLLGRDWLHHIKLNWREIKALAHHSVGSLEYLLEKYSDLFSDELGPIKNFKAKLEVDPEATPKFFKPRTVPYALKGEIERELTRLEQMGILEKVTHSEWAAPIVVVPKADGSVRICGDFKVTVNPDMKVDPYPLPKAEDLFATLAGGKRFTKIDLTQAYLQLELHPDSMKYCVVNTHRGLYQFTRLPFGIASAPAIFQKVMDTILQGAPGALSFIDDILVTGDSEEEHIRNLEEVLRRLAAHGVRVKRRKCFFMKESVEYLGHVVDENGIHATPDKMAAIDKVPMPQNVTQLRSFLGLLNYYRKFLPNLASILKPLNDLLQKNRKWEWSGECDKAMRTAKELLKTSNLLVHYDSKLPLKLATDASPYGLGAVISHVFPNGEEKPVAFASRTLSKSEENYSQIDKEALGLIYGVRKFHTYLFGRKFTLITDHKPLTSILGPNKGVSAVAAARLQRWALLLSAYTYELEFRSTKEHGNADALSRLPIPGTVKDPVSETKMYFIKQLESLPLTSKQIRQATERDPLLSKVYRYTLRGWPDRFPKELQPYYSRFAELSVEDGCLMWGGRVVIPKSRRKEILNELHREHMGMAKMKGLARGHVWWPGITKDIEALVKACKACAAVKQAPTTAPMYPWEWPQRPWERLHIDFAGPFMNQSFLIVVDAYSKWPEVVEMSQTTTAKTIIALRQIFATHGIPGQIVSDNGPQFVSADFEEFLRTNGIRHIRSAPYHPATNGEAERFVRTFKEAMKSAKSDGLTVTHRLQNFLLAYRTTPHGTTGTSPGELLMGRALRTRWDLLKPNLPNQVQEQQDRQKRGHDRQARLRSFQVGDLVMARNFRQGDAWIPGVIVRELGPLTYLVDVSEGRLWKRHVDHIKSRNQLPNENETVPSLPFSIPEAEPDPVIPDQEPVLNSPETRDSTPIPETTPRTTPRNSPTPETSTSDLNAGQEDSHSLLSLQYRLHIQGRPTLPEAIRNLIGSTSRFGTGGV